MNADVGNLRKEKDTQTNVHYLSLTIFDKNSSAN